MTAALPTQRPVGPRRALVCSPVLPEFDRESGSKRVLDLVDLLLADKWAVTFVCRQPTVPRYAAALRTRGVVTWCGVGRPDERLVQHGHFDLAVLAFWYVAEDYLPVIRRLSPRTRVLVDTVDVHFVRNARRAFLAGGGGQLDDGFASEMRRELNVYAAADGVLTVSGKEAGLLADLLSGATPAWAVPDCEEVPASPVPAAGRRGIVFVGNFRHAPNVDAIEFLCRDVLPNLDPAVRRAHPVSVVGNAPTEAVRQAVAAAPGVRLVGWVPDVLPYLATARAAVIPLRYGAGTKRKLIQALMSGTPAVTTTVGAEGLELDDGRSALVADDPAGFAAALARAATDDELWARLAAGGRAAVLVRHGYAAARDRLLEAVGAVLAREPKGRPAPPPAAGGSDDLPPRLTELLATAAVPPGAVVAVVSKGDDRLLEAVAAAGGRGEHFPQATEGQYAGHHPADGTEAVARLEGRRAAGVAFVAVPAPSAWWLDYYASFARHLADRYRLAASAPDVGVIYDVR